MMAVSPSPEHCFNRFWTFPVYFNNCVSFNCPVCRIEHTFLHQNKDNTNPVQPKQIIYEVHFGDLLGRDPIFPSIDKSDFYYLIPQKKRNGNHLML